MSVEVERINDQIAVIHLPVTVDSDDAPRLKQLLQTLYEEGVERKGTLPDQKRQGENGKGYSY